MKTMGNTPIVIQAKDCDNKEITLNDVDESMIVKRISGILQFTSDELFKPSFDLLAVDDCNDIDCLIESAKREFKDDVAKWITKRLRMLKTLIGNKTMKVTIPTCLKDFDEGFRRLIMGILYVTRQRIPQKIIIIDDVMSFVINMKYYEAFLAMMRPLIVANNRYPTTEELLMHNLNVLTPDESGGVHRLTRPDKYVVLFGHSRWEIPRREIERLANS